MSDTQPTYRVSIACENQPEATPETWEHEDVRAFTLETLTGAVFDNDAFANVNGNDHNVSLACEVAGGELVNVSNTETLQEIIHQNGSEGSIVSIQATVTKKCTATLTGVGSTSVSADSASLKRKHLKDIANTPAASPKKKARTKSAEEEEATTIESNEGDESANATAPQGSTSDPAVLPAGEGEKTGTEKKRPPESKQQQRRKKQNATKATVNPYLRVPLQKITLPGYIQEPEPSAVDAPQQEQARHYWEPGEDPSDLEEEGFDVTNPKSIEGSVTLQPGDLLNYRGYCDPSWQITIHKCAAFYRRCIIASDGQIITASALDYAIKPIWIVRNHPEGGVQESFAVSDPRKIWVQNSASRTQQVLVTEMLDRREKAKEVIEKAEEARRNNADNEFFETVMEYLPPFIKNEARIDSRLLEYETPPGYEDDLEDPVHWTTMPARNVPSSDEMVSTDGGKKWLQEADAPGPLCCPLCRCVVLQKERDFTLRWTEITAPFLVADKSHESLSVYQKHFEKCGHEPMWMFLPRVINSKGSELDLKHCVQMQLYNALEALPIDYQKLKNDKGYAHQRIGAILGFAISRCNHPDFIKKYAPRGTPCDRDTWKTRYKVAITAYKERTKEVLEEIHDGFSAFDIREWKKANSEMTWFKAWNLLHLFFLRGLYWTPSFPAVRNVTIEQGDLPILYSMEVFPEKPKPIEAIPVKAENPMAALSSGDKKGAVTTAEL